MATRPKAKSVEVLKSPANELLVPEGQRQCPICHQAMQNTTRENERIDVCQEHGVWLDRYELERMFLARLHRRGIRTRRLAEDAKQKGQLQGFFWGMLLG